MVGLILQIQQLLQENAPEELLADLLDILLFQEEDMDNEFLGVFVPMATLLLASWRIWAQERSLVWWDHIVLEIRYDQQGVQKATGNAPCWCYNFIVTG